MPEIAEVWKPIPGFENSYAASSHGRVRSLDRIVTARNQWTVFPRRWPGQILTPTMTPNGYLLVQLYEDGAKTWAHVHRLVLHAFRGECPPGMECGHYDGAPTNNRLENLRWCSHSENKRDSVRRRRQQPVYHRDAA